MFTDEEKEKAPSKNFVLTSDFFYKIYKAEKEQQQEAYLPKGAYKAIEKEMVDMIVEEIIENQRIFEMPQKLGQLMFRDTRNPLGFKMNPTKDGYVPTDYGRKLVPFWKGRKSPYVRNKSHYEFRINSTIVTRAFRFTIRAAQDPDITRIHK